jgi:hypothetical protein
LYRYPTVRPKNAAASFVDRYSFAPITEFLKFYKTALAGLCKSKAQQRNIKIKARKSGVNTYILKR